MNIDAGHDFVILNFTLTGSAQDITTTRPFRRAYLQARGDVDVQIRRAGGDSTWVTVKAGNGFVITASMIPASGTTTTICDARTTGAGETLEVVLTL